MDTNSYLHPLFIYFHYRYEGQRDMLYNQTYNLDQVAFAAEGLKDAEQTVYLQSYLRKTLISISAFL